MVLVDTSVWIDHFKYTSPKLVDLLIAGKVVIHDHVLGELSLAHFSKKDRDNIFDRLLSLERIEPSNHQDVYEFSLKQRLSGKGIGWIDAHLLHSCIQNQVELFTLDRNLSKIASKLLK